MGRHDWDFIERDIARSEDELEKLGANTGGVSKGIVTDLVGLFDTPNRERARQATQLAEASEYLAPAIARERGISEDDARAAITGGVQEPEPGYRSLGRLLGMVDAPEGEPFNVRMGRLRGMAGRMRDDDASRRQTLSSLGDLIEVAGQLEDPTALREPLSTAARRAGLGNVGNLKFRPPAYKNLWDYAARTGKDPVTIMQTMNARRGGGGGASYRPTQYEQVVGDLTSADPQRRAAAERYLTKGKGGGKTSKSPMRDLLKAKFEQDMMDPAKAEALDAELSARAAWVRSGRKGPEPVTPQLDRYSALAGEELGEDGLAALALEPDEDGDGMPDVGTDGEGVYTFEDHDDILNSVDEMP